MGFLSGVLIGIVLAVAAFAFGYQLGTRDTRQEMIEHDPCDEKGL
jgi:hypothetical protein